MKCTACVMFLVMHLCAVNTVLSCEVRESVKQSIEQVSNFNDVDICSALLTGMTGTSTKCESRAFQSDSIRVDVNVTGREWDFLRFDFLVIGPSRRLSEYVSDRGFESHAVELLFFLNLKCELIYWVSLKEPRYILGPDWLARDYGNKNWILYSSDDRLTQLREKLKTWIADYLKNHNGSLR